MNHQATLPAWLVADDGGGDDARDFVIHCHAPRFFMEFLVSEGVTTWIDDPPVDAALVARLMREAGDFYASTL